MSDEPAPTTASECTSFYFVQVIFQVQDTLFCVPRRYFERESEVFRTMFQLPVAQGAVPDGSSNEQPLRLEGVAKDDFRLLLRVMFPEQVLGPWDLSVPQWVSVLGLAALWEMERLKKNVLRIISNHKASRNAWLRLLEVAIQHHLPAARTLAIEKITSTLGTRGTEKVVLARKYRVKEWLQVGFQELVRRQEVISDDEGEKLGWLTVSKLYRIREGYRDELHQQENRPRAKPASSLLTTDQPPYIQKIDLEFEAELNAVAGEEDDWRSDKEDSGWFEFEFGKFAAPETDLS